MNWLTLSSGGGVVVVGILLGFVATSLFIGPAEKEFITVPFEKTVIKEVMVPCNCTLSGSWYIPREGCVDEVMRTLDRADQIKQRVRNYDRLTG